MLTEDSTTYDDSAASIAQDIEAVARIATVAPLLKLICSTTGMRFAAVARVTDGSWTACATEDTLGFGLKPGDQLDVNTTLCQVSRQLREPITIDQASTDPVYASHHTPRIYNIESYVSVPIVLPNGRYFGNLCAIDTLPAKVSDVRTLAMFESFAELIALQLDNESRYVKTEHALLEEKSASGMREQFIAVLAHDLRNPLAALSATTELLARTTAEPRTQMLVARMKTTAKRMALLIDDVMDFARGRLGSGVGVHVELVDDLESLLQEVVDELRDANLDRVIESKISVPATANCDHKRVQQLLSNLLANALVYGTSSEPVEVDVSARDGNLVMSVRNWGNPIAPEAVRRVFDPYWRSSAVGSGGGLGLGLFICSQVAAGHGGTIAVTSDAVDGTRFVATLPIICPASGVQ